jgi:hypothetical protein
VVSGKDGDQYSWQGPRFGGSNHIWGIFRTPSMLMGLIVGDVVYGLFCARMKAKEDTFDCRCHLVGACYGVKGVEFIRLRRLCEDDANLDPAPEHADYSLVLVAQGHHRCSPASIRESQLEDGRRRNGKKKEV